ncbi:hypothetical protein AYI70_g8038 [Smittium culicis]|uniref:Uncharacterized protein n=1 Tax=Smittium culicis TaxID=133412 RepID=A0A1R1XHT4_9FUNG|nr:hypothetical protein AYI70_g8038 [Smittium culicis]
MEFKNIIELTEPEIKFLLKISVEAIMISSEMRFTTHKNIATVDPGTDIPDNQYLFHPSTLGKMEIARQSSRNDKLNRQALSRKTSKNYLRQFHNQYQPSRGNPIYQVSSQARWESGSKWNQTGQKATVDVSKDWKPVKL